MNFESLAFGSANKFEVFVASNACALVQFVEYVAAEVLVAFGGTLSFDSFASCQ